MLLGEAGDERDVLEGSAQPGIRKLAAQRCGWHEVRVWGQRPARVWLFLGEPLGANGCAG